MLPPMPGAAAIPSEDEVLASIRPCPIAMVVTNPRLRDNPIIAANDAFSSLTGYPERDILGRNCRFLAGPQTESWLTDRIRESLHLARPILTEILNYRSDGSTFRNALVIAPMLDGEGHPVYFIGSQVDVGEESRSPCAQRRRRAVELVKGLSPRQRQILAEVAAGYRNKQIAWRISLSEKTVKMHRALLLERLGVSTTAEAIRVAVEAGL